MRLGKVASAVAIILLTGCESPTLVTGYKPRLLGSSDAARRGYYARPFTPESQAAGMEREQELQMRRPTPGY